MGIFKRMRAPVADEEIIELYWNRDERAVEETDLKYRKYLFTIAYNILYSNEDSEECLNDTYMGAWQAIPPQRPLNLKAFLKLRDGSHLFDSVREMGSIGIPAIVKEDGCLTLDWDEFIN